MLVLRYLVERVANPGRGDDARLPASQALAVPAVDYRSRPQRAVASASFSKRQQRPTEPEPARDPGAHEADEHGERHADVRSQAKLTDYV